LKYVSFSYQSICHFFHLNFERKHCMWAQNHIKTLPYYHVNQPIKSRKFVFFLKRKNCFILSIKQLVFFKKKKSRMCGHRTELISTPPAHLLLWGGTLVVILPFAFALLQVATLLLEFWTNWFLDASGIHIFTSNDSLPPFYIIFYHLIFVVGGLILLFEF